ncbi:hypothetical protein HUJ04_002830 [Dendroctonus ponderosae]|uniref:TRUD domain-containing protein n=1 Tax=Dendroctonus ponderosae TaxID=77166 RepID=A0AAR5P838_DENPD|nr:hypothetical protein HUJ04_002830 [Dendroctonus ponderosae]
MSSDEETVKSDRQASKRRYPFKKGHVKRDNHTYVKREYVHHDQLSEKDVGIDEYISKLAGYPAVIKARYSDFQVNEIDLAGNRVKLTDRNLPKEFEEPAELLYIRTEQSPFHKISQDKWESLRKMVSESDNEASDQNHPHLVELDAEDFTKDERKMVHECIRKHFGQKVVTSTITKDSKTIIQLKKWGKKSKDTRCSWPEGLPEYVHFVMYKEMMDTIDACFKMGQVLRISASGITYAGVKDKRAKTSQWCCVRKFPPAKLLSNAGRIRNLKVGNIIFKDHCLKIGQLSGNFFRIALRNVQAEDILINESINHVKEHGFINYYGLQRFGNDKEAPTFTIGIKLIKGEWKEAIDLILKVKAADDKLQANNQAKKVYAETGNAKRALLLCDKQRQTVEKKLLEGLVKHHQNNPLNALENIPRSVRLMYMHAFQSLIWNKMTSKRIEKFGLKPVEGDLIIVDKPEDAEVAMECPEEEEEDATDGDANEKTDVDEDLKEKKGRFTVRPLTSDELYNYSIYDIVLPLPGYDVVYPEHLKEYYKEAIEEHGLTLEMPEKKVKTYNLSGTYRKIVQHVKDLEWKILCYNDPTDNLIRSDLEELSGVKEPETIAEGQYKAIVLSFSLPSACYATMVLREILKCNTSTSSQAGLNNYGVKKPTTNRVIINVDTEAKQWTDLELPQVGPGSLLADAAKYEDFKKLLFKDVLAPTDSDCPEAKEPDDEGDNEGPAKKMKTNGHE